MSSSTVTNNSITGGTPNSPQGGRPTSINRQYIIPLTDSNMSENASSSSNVNNLNISRRSLAAISLVRFLEFRIVLYLFSI